MRRYSVTTFEPGARLVLTCGGTRSPRRTAFRASSPAPSITDGFEVLVQLVIAAITTEPCRSSAGLPPSSSATFLPLSSGVSPKPRSLTGAVSAFWNELFMAESGTRSCGRFGPARLGSTVARSSSSVSLNTGSGIPAVRNRPCSLV